MSASYDMIEKAKENAAKRRAARKAEIEAVKKARADEKKEQEAKKITAKDRLKMGLKKFFTAAMFTLTTFGPAPKVNSGSVNSSSDSSSEIGKEITQMPKEDNDTLYLSSKETMNEKIAELRKRNKMRADSLKKATQQNIELTGYDIKYEKTDYDDTWTIETKDGGGGFIAGEDLDYGAIERTYREEHEKLFSQPLKYIDTTVSVKDFTIVTEERVKPIYGGYDEYDNTIIIPHYTLEGKDELADSIMSICHYSKEQADSLVMAIYNTVNNEESIRHTKLHEKIHHDDYEAGYFVPNLPLEYIYKLHMLKEIKANMAEGGLSLQDYEKDGKVSHFCWMNHEVDTLELQKKLPEVSDAETRKEVVGEYFFNKWLEEYNVENSVYTYQAMDMVWGGGIPSQQFFLMEHMDDDNEEFRQEYLRRVDGMFKDVPGLGDMRKFIDPDFKLNDQLQSQVDAMKTGGLKELTKNCSTIEEMYERDGKLLMVVRDSDADGVRTQEEQDLINKTILIYREKAKQARENPQENEKSAGQTYYVTSRDFER